MDTNFLRRRAWWTRRERLDIKVIYTQIRYKIVGNERSSGINGWQQLSDGKIEILITDGSNANFCSFIEPTVWLCDIVSRNRWKIRHEFFQTPAQQISNQLFALRRNALDGFKEIKKISSTCSILKPFQTSTGREEEIFISHLAKFLLCHHYCFQKVTILSRKRLV